MLSVIEHLRAENVPSAFVTRDSAFDDGALESFAESLGVPNLQHFTEVSGLEKILVEHAKGLLLKAWNEDAAKLRAVLEQMAPALKEALQGLTLNQFQLGIIGTVVGAPSVKSLEINKVSTPPPWERKTNERLSVSFNADATIEVSVIASLTFQFHSITIGESGSMQISTPLQRDEREVKVPIRFEATAVFDGTTYKDVQVTSVSANQGMLSMLSGEGYSSFVLDASKS